MESPSAKVSARIGFSGKIGTSRYRVQAVEEHSAGARKALHEISSGPPRPLVTDEEILHGLDSLNEVEHLQGIVRSFLCRSGDRVESCRCLVEVYAHLSQLVGNLRCGGTVEDDDGVASDIQLVRDGSVRYERTYDIRLREPGIKCEPIEHIHLLFC